MLSEIEIFQFFVSDLLNCDLVRIQWRKVWEYDIYDTVNFHGLSAKSGTRKFISHFKDPKNCIRIQSFIVYSKRSSECTYARKSICFVSRII